MRPAALMTILALGAMAAPAALAQDRTPSQRQTLLELARTLGESHALRLACRSTADQRWRNLMQRVVELEAADEAFKARLNEAWARADVLSLLGQVEAGPFARWPRLYLTLAADDPFFAGNAAVHLALGEAGIRHRFTVTEGRHDWIFWRQALPEALRHLGAVMTRQYGE